MEDNLPNAQLFAINAIDNQYEDIIPFLNMHFAPVEFIIEQKKQLVT